MDSSVEYPIRASLSLDDRERGIDGLALEIDPMLAVVKVDPPGSVLELMQGRTIGRDLEQIGSDDHGAGESVETVVIAPGGKTVPLFAIRSNPLPRPLMLELDPVAQYRPDRLGHFPFC